MVSSVRKQRKNECFYWTCCSVRNPRPPSLNPTSVKPLLKYHHRYTQGCVFMVILNPAKLPMKFNHHRSQNTLCRWEEEMCCHWCKLWLHVGLVLWSFFGFTVHLLFYVIFPRIKSWARDVIALEFINFPPHQLDKKKVDQERREGREDSE